MQRIPRGIEPTLWKENTKRPAKIRANETILRQPVCKPTPSGFFTVPFPGLRESFLTLHKSFNPVKGTPFGFLLRFHFFYSPLVFPDWIEIRAYSRLREKDGGRTKKFRRISRGIQSAARSVSRADETLLLSSVLEFERRISRSGIHFWTVGEDYAYLLRNCDGRHDSTYAREMLRLRLVSARRTCNQ